jgi:Fibronectin type III domain.
MKDLRYQVVLKEADGSHAPATIIYEDKGICAYTIRELKSNTAYSINVYVIDEDDRINFYYENREGLTVTTLEDKSGDTQAPTVRDRQLRVVDKTNHSIIIQWDRATDETTNYSHIQYLVGIRKADSHDSWRIDREGKAFDSHILQNLEPDTAYSIFVKAYDEAGNVTQYSRAGPRTVTVNHPKKETNRGRTGLGPQTKTDLDSQGCHRNLHRHLLGACEGRRDPGQGHPLRRRAHRDRQTKRITGALSTKAPTSAVSPSRR